MSFAQNKNALLNEYKGSLFEFLVAKNISKNCSFETDFLNSLTDEQVKMLSQQESYLRSNFQILIDALPLLAKRCADEICDSFNINELNSVVLVGMNAKASSEVDILLGTRSDQIPLSLKLSKSGSFTNTKSAGVKSFVQKYFDEDQTEFNRYYENEFSQLAIDMYIEAGEEASSDFRNWEQSGRSTLPGELDDNYRSLLLGFYNKINEQLFSQIKNIKENDISRFKQGIKRLLGFSSNDIVQVTCFYKTLGNQIKYEHSLIKNIGFLQNLDYELIDFTKSKNSFTLGTEKFSLQIRLKPMNKFTHSSYKVNCAVKFN